MLLYACFAHCKQIFNLLKMDHAFVKMDFILTIKLVMKFAEMALLLTINVMMEIKYLGMVVQALVKFKVGSHVHKSLQQ